MKKNKTIQLSGQVLIDASAVNVWNVVKQFGNIAAYHPMVKASHAINDEVALGARRYCQLLPTGVMEEEVVEWEEGRKIVAEVTGGKMLPPCHFMNGILELKPQQNRTQVTFTFSYQMKYGWLGNLMNRFMIEPQFKKAPVKYVNGLKHYLESGFN
ncbi:MAG: SRPBCC family protein [Cyclobacteriaceae bacterium]